MPLIVLKTIGKKAAIKIIAIAGKLPIPNQSTTKGDQAIGDIGLINCKSGSMAWNSAFTRPNKNPIGTPIKMARTNPTMKRNKLINK